MGDTSVTQLVVEVLGAPDVSPDTSVTQVLVEILGLPDVSPDTSVTQIVVEVLGAALPPNCFTVCVGKRVLYTQAEWSSTSKWYFEAFIKANTGTSKARLYDVTGDFEVPSSVVETTSTDYVRLRSSIIALNDGHEYCGQFGVPTGGSDEGVGISMDIINI